MPPQPSLYAIDFGTSNSLLAAVGNDFDPEVLDIDPLAKDPTVFRSILFLSEQSEWSFGAGALRRYVEEGMRGRFLRSLKRFLPMASFEETRLGSRNVRLEELVGIFLREMRRRANEHYATDVRRVLLGRPARFAVDPAADALAEQRLFAAARFAGFEEVTFCAEPVAAAYDFQSRLDSPKLVLVADFGGGTSDFTVARLGIAAGAVEVLSMGGVAVAGDVLDGTIMRHKVSRHFGSEVTYRAPFGRNVLKMPRPLMEALCSPADTCLLARRDVKTFLRDVQSGSLGPHDKEHVDQLVVLIEDALGFQIFESIEQAKRELSGSDETAFRFDYPSIQIEEIITRREFRSFSEVPIAAIFRCLDQTLEESGVASPQIERGASGAAVPRRRMAARADISTPIPTRPPTQGEQAGPCPQHGGNPMKPIIPIVCLAFIGCASQPVAQAPSANTASSSSAARPDVALVKKHFKDHVQYPASRAAVLAACADTPEFSAGEKKWLADNLPDRTFASADDIATALHL